MDKGKKKTKAKIPRSGNASRKPSIVIMPSDNDEISTPVSPVTDSTLRLNVEEKRQESPVRPRTPKILLTPRSTSSPSDSEDGTTELTEQTDEATQQLRLPVRLSKDEMYTDKDRAAAVALGSKDIKVSLLMKKQEEIKRMMPEEKGSSIYYNQGMFGYRRGNIPVAKDLLQKALQLQPNSLRCLVARARCHLDDGDTEGALEDAETALKMDSQCDQALLVKADALYRKGDFEQALLHYHWGFRMRPGMSHFKRGIWKSEEAIRNSVGKSVNVKLKPNNHSASSPKQKLSSQFLQELNYDKTYMSQLLHNKALKNRRQDSTGKIVRTLAQETVDYLQSRQNFWHQQDPFRNPRQSSAPARYRTKTKRKTEKEDRFSVQMAERVKELENAIGTDYEDYLSKCFNLLDMLETLPESKLRKKPELLATLYSLLGNAHLQEKDFESAIFYHEMDLEMGEKRDLPKSKSRALDNLGRCYAMSQQYQKAIDMWERKLQIKTKVLEEAWLHHEIGRCHYELGNYKKAKECGGRCRDLAESEGFATWKLNAAILIAQAEVCTGHKEEALADFACALAIAQAQKNRSIQSAIMASIRKLKNTVTS